MAAIRPRKVILMQLSLLFVAVLIFSSKLVAWWFTGSLVILGDALESIVNVTAASFTLYSLVISNLPKDKNHPYGHGKIEFIASTFEGLLLIFTAIGIVIKAVLDFISEPVLQRLEFGILVIVLGAVLNLAFGFAAVRFAEQVKSPALDVSGQHLKIDAYSSVVVILALILVNITGLVWLDALLAIVLACYILFCAVKILRSSIAGIMDEADVKLISKLADYLELNRQKTWVDIHKTRFIRFGGQLHLDCHLTLPWFMNLNEAHLEIDKLQLMVNELFDDEVEIYVHTDNCQSYACPICINSTCPKRKADFVKALQWREKNLTATRQHSYDQL